jgi:5-methylcytosine-specific restriction enzyme subunit McrC
MLIHEYENVPLSIPSEFRQYFSSTWDGVKATQYCGALKVGDQTLTILPKIDKHNDTANLRYLTYMLSYVYDLKVDESVASTDTEKSPILELLISIFSRELIGEVEKGLYREYISVQDNLRVMRGRFLAGIDARTNFVRDKIYCEYDEFSPDNSLNALLAYTVNVCRRMSKSDDNRRKLGMLHLMFDEVTPYYNPHTVIHWHRLNERFRHLYKIALLILQNLTIRFDKAGANEWAFMFDMNVLFEKFIAKLIKETLVDCDVGEQERSRFGEKNTKPDIVIRRNGDVQWVVDTKYKRIAQNSDISPCDTYQVFAYANIADFGDNLKRVMLLYPKHLEMLDKIVPLPNEVEMYIKSIELQSEASDFRGYIEEMKKRIGDIL